MIRLHSVGPDGQTCSCRKGANCSSKGKHPIDNSWQNTPALSAPDIQELWESYPKSNIGIATGDPSGFWVLDIDPEHGGLEAWREIKGDREIPKTYAVRTGSGGWHFYFAMPADQAVTNSPAAFKGTGIDIRGTGGQVVAPPSVSDKGVYTAYDAPVAEAPEWLLELVKPQSPVGPVVLSSDVPDRSTLSQAERDRLDMYAAKAWKANLDRLDRLAVTGWDGEPWNHTTFEVSCALLEIANSGWNAYTPQQAYTAVFAHAPRDTEGFDDDTVNKTFQSAATKVGDKARAVPEGKPAQQNFDFMTAPGIPRDPRLDPSQGGGDLTTPAVGTGGGPDRFFRGKNATEFDPEALAAEILAGVPVAYGANLDFWTYRDGVWVYSPDHLEDTAVDLLKHKYRNGHVHNTRPVVRRHARVLKDEPDGQWINFRNGMLDWRTGDLVEHSPDFESTVQLGTTWEPEATCPRFDRWLESVMHEDYVQVVWEMLGYLMYSGNPLQVAFMLYGTGGNGKGTLIRVIEDLIGRGNYASESLQDLNTNRFSAVNLFGRIANIAGDIDGTYLESTANFKKLTGEDVYAAEKKFGDRFTFKSWAVPLFSANKIPGSADVSEGYLRRWVILHFDRTFANPIRSLSDGLSEELPGIAAKAVSALRTLMSRGKFDPTGRAAEGKTMFAETIDQMRQWVKNGVLAAPDRHENCTTLYRAYTAWAEQQHLGRLKMPEFCHRLEALGYPHEHQGLQGHIGLMVGPQVDERGEQAKAAFWTGVTSNTN